MEKRLFMPMHLQLFASDTGSDGGNGQEGTLTNQEGSQSPDLKPEGEDDKGGEGKVFTRDEVAKMIAAETSKVKQTWENEQQERDREAAKVAKMNAEEKEAHERKKLEDQIAEYERKEALNERSKEVSKMLYDAKLPISEGLLDLLTHEDEECAKQAVATIIAFASELSKENARQVTPRESASFSGDKNKPTNIAELAEKTRIIEK